MNGKGLGIIVGTLIFIFAALAFTIAIPILNDSAMWSHTSQLSQLAAYLEANGSYYAGAATLTSGRVPFADASGDLVDDADLSFSTDTLSASNVTSSGNIIAGYFSGDGTSITNVDAVTIDGYNAQRTTTFVVAASDAPASVIAQADYVCDGTADDVQIQAANDALSAGRTWQETIKLIGTFDLDATVSFDSYTVIDATQAIIKPPAAADIILFQVVGSGGSEKTHVDIIGGLYLGNNLGSPTSLLYADYMDISKWVNVDVRNSGAIGIKIQNSDSVYLDHPVIVDCSSSGLDLYVCNDALITQPNIWGNSNGASGNGNLSLAAIDFLTVLGGNLDTSYRHNINCWDVTDSRFTNIRMTLSSIEGAGSYDHMVLDGNSLDNIVSSCTFTSANSKTRYWVNIGSGSNYNTFIGNNMYDAPVTARVNDAGTGNVFKDNQGYAGTGDVKTIKKTCDHASITDGGGATGYIDFDEAIPAGSIIQAVQFDYTEAFNSDDTTTLTIMVGSQADLDAYNLTADPGENGFNTTTDAYWGESSCQAPIVTSATTPRVTFTEDDDCTDTINSANAQGTVVIYVTYMKA